MGVDNLLGFVDKSLNRNTTLRTIKVENTTAAVDVSHWIYRAAYACPEVLFTRQDLHKAYNIIVNYIDNYVKLLKAHKVKLIFVFDGMKLPAKKVTHDQRSARKAEARQLADKFLKSSNKSEARKQMLRCIDIKFDVVEQVIKYCQKNKIKYYVAPYEADAQLAYLNNNNMCDFVITEDTDLILYGCSKIIYKLDTDGHCMLYQKNKLARCFGPRGDEVEFEKFRRICIMSGCDYLKNIPSVGLQSAKKFFLCTKQDNLELLLPKLAVYLNNPKLKGKVTQEYVKGFLDAESTFHHHIVYCPKTNRARPLEDYPPGKTWTDFPSAGKLVHKSVIRDLVEGRVNLDMITEDDLEGDTDMEDTEEDEDDDDEAMSQDEATTRGQSV